MKYAYTERGKEWFDNCRSVSITELMYVAENSKYNDNSSSSTSRSLPHPACYCDLMFMSCSEKCSVLSGPRTHKFLEPTPLGCMAGGENLPYTIYQVVADWPAEIMVSVCQKTRGQKLHQRCDTLCTSGFVDDVILSHSGPHGTSRVGAFSSVLIFAQRWRPPAASRLII